jgi:hypothetical protein
VPTGAVYLFLGNARGLPTAPTSTLTAPAGILGDFGGVVAGAGDINGDGFDDLLVGAIVYEGIGTVCVYSGGPSALSGNPTVTLTSRFDNLE